MEWKYLELLTTNNSLVPKRKVKSPCYSYKRLNQVGNSKLQLQGICNHLVAYDRTFTQRLKTTFFKRRRRFITFKINVSHMVIQKQERCP